MRVGCLTKPVDSRSYPVLGVGTEREGTPEDEIENRHHNREAEPRVGKNLIYLLQACLIGIILGVRKGLRQNTVHIGAIGILISLLVTEVIDRVRGRGSPLHDFNERINTILQAIVLPDRNPASRHTYQLLQFRNIERVVCFQEEVIPANSQDYFLLLIDDMRCEHKRILKACGIDHLQDDIKDMSMQLIEVVDLHKVHILRSLVSKGLQALHKR